MSKIVFVEYIYIHIYIYVQRERKEERKEEEKMGRKRDIYRQEKQNVGHLCQTRRDDS